MPHWSNFVHNSQGCVNMSSRQKKEEKTDSRLQCGTVPFQRVPSQKSRGDPSRTPPSSHLVLARSSMIEILGVDLRSNLPINFTERENQLGIITVGCHTIYLTWWEWFCFSLKSKNRTTRFPLSATKGDRVHWTFVAAFFWVTCTCVTCKYLSFPLLSYE